MTKEYESIVCNGYTTKKFLDLALKELTDKGYTFTTTFMGNMIIMERPSTLSPFEQHEIRRKACENSDNK